MRSTANSIGLNTVLCDGFKVLFYFFSFFLTIFLRNQLLELWSVVLGKVKLKMALSGIFLCLFLIFKPFLSIFLLSLFNHLQFGLFWSLIELRNWLSDINIFKGSCLFLDGFPELKFFILKFFLHDCPRILIFTELLVELKELSDGFSASGFCFFDTSLVFLLDSLDNRVEILLRFSLVIIDSLLTFLFNLVNQLRTPFSDFDISQTLIF